MGLTIETHPTLTGAAEITVGGQAQHSSQTSDAKPGIPRNA